MNSFGLRFRVTTFGESHGVGIGCVVDGVPAGLKIEESFIQTALDRRKPGKTPFATARKESDKAQILSGVFEGKSTGTPIAIFIQNENQKSRDYSNIKDLFRPSHGDFTYFSKYGIRDYRGGGRSSARETAARVAASAIADLMLQELDINVKSGISGIGEIWGKSFDFEHAKQSEIFALDKSVEEAQKEAILQAKKSHDSIGGKATIKIQNLPVGLGEPLYYKLDAILAQAMMGINGVKAVEIGEGFNASALLGSQNNDPMDKNGFLSNHAGGILAGISSGDEVDIHVYFKPTPSIFQPQQTIDTAKNELTCNLRGRHDPCIAVRGSIVAEAMTKLVIADMLLLNMGSTIEQIKKLYM